MSRVSGEDSVFPAEIYKDTVLEPLFEGAKQHFARHLMRVNHAHAIMLAERGIIAGPEAAAIIGALRTVQEDLDLENLTYSGEHEDFFFFLEAQLEKRLGVDLAGRLHTGRSRNDIGHTVFKMELRDRLSALVDQLAALIGTVISVAEANRETIVVAYTHGQPAQPTTFGHYLGAFVELSLRDLERLFHAGRLLDACPMGAAAITTTGFDIDRERMAELLGFAGVQENSYGCIAACDYVTELYSALKVMFINLGRLAQDLNQWTGFETGHIRVPDGYVQISSIMPQKRNPVAIEHMRLMASRGAGHADAIVDTMRNTPFTDVNDTEDEVQIAGYAAFDVATRLLRLLEGFIGAISIDETRVREHIRESCITITELADSLVRIEGISFRQAHDVAARLATLVTERGETLDRVAHRDFAEIFATAIGHETSLSEADLRRLATPEHFIAVRERYGGPGPKALAASLTGYAERLTELASRARAARERDTAVREKLHGLIEAYVARSAAAVD